MNVRLSKEQKIKILNCDDVYQIMRDVLMRERKISRDKEHFWIIGLNNANTILFVELISLGAVNVTTAEPMEVYSFALQKRAVKIILVHNHPSGNLEPSEPDKDTTNKLIQVGKFLRVPVIDHLIITEESFYSFAESGLLDELAESKKYVMQYLLEEEYKRKNAERDGIMKVARELKRKGIDIDVIAETTGLKKTSIHNLKID